MERIGTVEEAYAVFQNISELEQYLTIEAMHERLPPDSVILVSECEGELIGFKIGYPLDETTFYSWLGGVIPDHRKSGAAQRLLALQERLAKQNGFAAVEVKSMNRFRPMLHLLIANGYEVTEVEHYEEPDNERICFRKRLQTVDS